MTTVDQVGRLVLDFYRCAMLPLSADRETGHADDLSGIGADLAPPPDPTADWDADAYREKVPGAHFDPGLGGRGAAQHRRRRQQRAGARPADAEHRCHAP